MDKDIFMRFLSFSWRSFFSLALLSFSLASENPAPSPPSSSLIPRAVLFGNPEKARARVSPDGSSLAFLAPYEGVLNIFVAPQGDLSLAQPATKDLGRGILQYGWTYAPDILIYGQDCDGDENTRLYKIDLKSHEITPISPPNALSHVLAATETLPYQIVIASNQRTLEYFDLYMVNLLSGETALYFENNQQFDAFILDDSFQIRFTSKNQSDGSIRYYQRNGADFSPYMDVPFEDAETTSLLGLSTDGETLYLSDSRFSDKAILWELDLESGYKHMIGSSEKVDLSDLIVNPRTGKAEGYIENYLKPEVIFLDPIFEAKWSLISKIAQGELNIASRSSDDRIWIVAFTRSDRDSSYYWVDTLLQSHKFLFDSRPELAQYALNPLEPVVITARDGLEMVSYLTLPHGQTLQSLDRPPAPLVLIVHGGPVARDDWGLDPEHQWLSNRGFAVLAVNYRSSSGFGKAMIRAGDGEWGGKMHTDLLDAIEWAVANKITTHDQVAIYGGSYGGYATLVGLTMTPDVFRCGVDIVGPSNLKTLLDTIPPYWAPYKQTLRRRLGLGIEWSAQDDAILAERSPLTFAQHIERPILIAQGANDPRVKQAESDQIVAAMKEKGIPYTYMLFPLEGHGFARPENRKAFYAVTEQFLTKQFGLPYEPIGQEIALAQVQITEM